MFKQRPRQTKTAFHSLQVASTLTGSFPIIRSTANRLGPSSAVLPSVMRQRRWSSWAAEHLSGEHVADHIAQGSSGWWKWITNKHKSGKLQASAPELPQLRKTIRQQLCGEKKGARGGRKKKKKKKKTLTGSHKSSETELQCPLSLTRAHLWLGSLDLFTSTFSEDQSGLSDGLPRQEMTPAGSSLWEKLHEGSGRLTERVWRGWLDTPDTQKIREHELDRSPRRHERTFSRPLKWNTLWLGLIFFSFFLSFFYFKSLRHFVQETAVCRAPERTVGKRRPRSLTSRFSCLSQARCPWRDTHADAVSSTASSVQ